MAVDEAVLETYRGSPELAPTLRLYAFRPPALSLGKSQPSAAVRDPVFLREAGLDLVRRPTGGRAVLHDRERTYAVIGRLGRPPFDAGVLETYRRIAGALESALRLVGVDARAARPDAAAPAPPEPAAGAACFGVASAHEITVCGRKLVGSAQLRRGGAFLQHGSIPWDNDAQRLGRVLGGSVDPRAFTDLERAAVGALDPERLDRALVRGFEERFGIDLEPGVLSERERLRAAQLRCWKHLSATWTIDARVGERELSHGPAWISRAR